MQSGKSLKDQGKSRTTNRVPKRWKSTCRNPLKIRASLGLGGAGEAYDTLKSQSLKDQGKSRTLDSLAFARRQSFSLRKH